jgi:hypothetical protein
MVCLRNICINTLHKGDDDDNNNNKFPVHAMKIHGGTEVQFLSFITWVINGVAW